uniref:Autophagy-related protein 14 n=1 Tax=Rhizochromulina marina TaxID=1034831 RepID=A0A7S2RF45_9STRA
MPPVGGQEGELADLLQESFAVLSSSEWGGEPLCGVCESTERLVCNACARRQLAVKWESLESSRRQGVLLRQKLKVFLQRKAAGAARHRVTTEQLNRLQRVAAEEREVSSWLSAKHLELEKARLTVEQQRREVAKLQKALVTQRGSREGLQGVVMSELDWHFSSVVVHVQSRRWRRALRVMETFQVSSPEGGVPQILGLPLPDSPGLRACVPALELSSAVSALARLVVQLSEVLDLSLPHRILLDPPSAPGFAAIEGPVGQLNLLRSPDVGSPAPAVSDVDSSRGGFLIALSLLQVDIMNLCIRSGAEASSIHPESMVRNILELAATGQKFLHVCWLQAVDALPLDARAGASSSPAPSSAGAGPGPSSPLDDWEAIDAPYDASSQVAE